MPDVFASTADEDLQLLRSAAVTAGILAAYFRRDLKHWTKEHDSPVSEADIVLDRYLRSTLMAARPDYGWLSEETADNSDRLGRRRVFVVDPIDGTRGFIRGEDSWTVALAVVEDQVAIAGVIYAPARDEMYEASTGGGARLNGERLERWVKPGRKGPLIPAPGAVHQELQAAGLDYVRGPAYPSLAYRLDFEDVCMGALRFNAAEIRHGALAALADHSLKAPLHAALIRVYGCPADALQMERQSP